MVLAVGLVGFMLGLGFSLLLPTINPPKIRKLAKIQDEPNMNLNQKSKSSKPKSLIKSPTSHGCPGTHPPEEGLPAIGKRRAWGLGPRIYCIRCLELLASVSRV